MKVTVTGSRGFIGSNLLIHLKDLGYEAFGLDKDNCDLSTPKDIEVSINRINPEVIFHLAAQLPDSKAKTEDFFRDNVRSVFNILEASRHLKSPRFIFFSTMNVYGKPEYLPVDESHPTEPVNIYGLTKLMAEHMFKFYSENFGYKVVVLRFSGVFGPGRDTGAIATFISRALKEKVIEINSDGSDTWDAIYINDAISASIAALKKIDSVDYDIFNIGYGKGLVVREVAEKIIGLTDSSSCIKFGKSKSGINFYYDIKKAKKEIRFAPSSFEGNVKDFITNKKQGSGVFSKK